MAWSTCPKCLNDVPILAVKSQTRKSVLDAGKVKVFHLTQNENEGDHLFTMNLPSEPDHRDRLLRELEITE
jgi:hypothetical protein